MYVTSHLTASASDAFTSFRAGAHLPLHCHRKREADFNLYVLLCLPLPYPKPLPPSSLTLEAVSSVGRTSAERCEETGEGMGGAYIFILVEEREREGWECDFVWEREGKRDTQYESMEQSYF